MKAPSVKLPLLHRGKAGSRPGSWLSRVDHRTKNITKRPQPRRDRHHRPFRPGPGQRRGAHQAQGRGRRQRLGQHYRALLPTLGPKLLLDAGIPVVDRVGQDVLVKVADGAVVRLDEETLYLG